MLQPSILFYHNTKDELCQDIPVSIMKKIISKSFLTAFVDIFFIIAAYYSMSLFLFHRMIPLSSGGIRVQRSDNVSLLEIDWIFDPQNKPYIS